MPIPALSSDWLIARTLNLVGTVNCTTVELCYLYLSQTQPSILDLDVHWIWTSNPCYLTLFPPVS